MARALFQPSMDFQTAVAMGAIENVEHVSDYAEEEDLAADTPTILGTGSGVLTLPPDTGTTIQIASTDAGNAGAIIRMEVLDLDFKRVQVDVPITGIGTFTVDDPADPGNPLTVTRVNNAQNFGPRGTGEIDVDMEIQDTGTPTTVYGIIRAVGQALFQAVYTTPAGFDLLAMSLTGSMRKSQGADADIELRLFGAQKGLVFQEIFSFGLQRSGDTSLEFTNRALEAFKGPVDLYLEVESSAVASVSARITARIVK